VRRQHLRDKGLCQIRAEGYRSQLTKEDEDEAERDDCCKQAPAELFRIFRLGHHRHHYSNSLIAVNRKANCCPYSSAIEGLRWGSGALHAQQPEAVAAHCQNGPENEQVTHQERGGKLLDVFNPRNKGEHNANNEQVGPGAGCDTELTVDSRLHGRHDEADVGDCEAVLS